MATVQCGRCHAEAEMLDDGPPVGWRTFVDSNGEHYTLCERCRLWMVENIVSKLLERKE